MGEPFGCGPACEQDVEALGVALICLVAGIDVEPVELVWSIPASDTEVQSSAGQQVDR